MKDRFRVQGARDEGPHDEKPDVRCQMSDVRGQHRAKSMEHIAWSTERIVVQGAGYRVLVFDGCLSNFIRYQHVFDTFKNIIQILKSRPFQR